MASRAQVWGGPLWVCRISGIPKNHGLHWTGAVAPVESTSVLLTGLAKSHAALDKFYTGGLKGSPKLLRCD